MRLSPMIYLYIALGIGAFLWFLWAFSAEAAEFRVIEGKKQTHVFMKGKLVGYKHNSATENSDARKFFEIIKDKKLKEKYTLYLNSTGGSITTAMRIGAMVRKNGVRTFIPQNSQCLSACFLIFIAGYDMDRGKHDRWKHKRAKLGIHRPRSVKHNGEIVDRYKKTAPYTIALRRYLQAFDAGEGIFDKMINTHWKGMYYLSNRKLKDLGGYTIFGGSSAYLLYDALDWRYRPRVN